MEMATVEISKALNDEISTFYQFYHFNRNEISLNEIIKIINKHRKILWLFRLIRWLGPRKEREINYTKDF
jgi:hypothetical protein